MDQHIIMRKSVFLILADMVKTAVFADKIRIVDGFDNVFTLQVFDNHIKLDITRLNR